MILIERNDEIVRVGISVKDMHEAPDEMELVNRQSKEAFAVEIYDVSEGERCGIFKFYNIRNSNPTHEDDVTYLSLPDGSYDYRVGNEIGLFQIGVPTLAKTEYQTNTNNIVYYGEQ